MDQWLILLGLYLFVGLIIYSLVYEEDSWYEILVIPFWPLILPLWWLIKEEEKKESDCGCG